MLDHRMKTFLTLCETMNYRAAAEQLHITQPAVTQHIHYLEEYYGCKLFTYDGRKLAKTEQGMLLERSTHAMNYQEQHLILEMQERQTPVLSIGATKTIGEFVIAGQLARYLAQKNRRLSLVVDNTKQILERLDQGELDFALVEGYFSRSDYANRFLREEAFVGLCSSDHPLAGQSVALEALFSEDLLLREEGSGTREIFETMLLEHNRTISDFERVTCINNTGLLADLVAEGCGITFGYAALAEKKPKLAQFTVSGWEVSREFNYVYLINSGAERLVDEFDACRQRN